jgi:hypothetical protein
VETSPGNGVTLLRAASYKNTPLAPFCTKWTVPFESHLWFAWIVLLL